MFSVVVFDFQIVLQPDMRLLASIIFASFQEQDTLKDAKLCATLASKAEMVCKTNLLDGTMVTIARFSIFLI